MVPGFHVKADLFRYFFVTDMPRRPFVRRSNTAKFKYRKIKDIPLAEGDVS